uniref:RNA-directed DNA polymerase, eukaryota n=1 Tax=Tanacetum cinerariifolium TaxID=118510 RepID=A0A699IJ91_TANCI|nr:RNA-directed DNA polymerase, eukaryota [Tanacetum cinerariifolium]
MAIMNNLTSLDNMDSIELAQKAKVKWSIEGNENSKFFHGIFNKRRNNLAIRGIIVDEEWIEDLIAVKNEFLSHFQTRFETHYANLLILDMDFPNRLSPDQAQDMKRVFWSLIEGYVVEVVNHFFNNGFCHKGGNYSFIALILKTQGAKMVKDFRPISLIGSLYKIITKLLANHLVIVIDGLVNEVQPQTGRSSIAVPVYSCHGKSLPIVLKGCQWHWCYSNISTIIRMLDCFFRASVLRINLHKSKLMGIAVENSLVNLAANSISCMTLNHPFQYLGVNIGGHMSWISSWDVVINKILGRLSKWKSKVLYVGGRLTLLKSFVGSTPIYYMSMFKAPIHVINKLKAICSHFFNGVDPNVRKMTFVKWENVLTSKENGGLGVSSFYALNCALIFKWVWRFHTQSFSLWSRLFALELNKTITVAGKMAHPSLGTSFRRNPRSGTKQSKMAMLLSHLEGIRLPNMLDRWSWSLSGDGEFFVSSTGNLIDDKTLGTVGSKMQ